MNTSENKSRCEATVLGRRDDPGARCWSGTALEMAGFRVATAADGAAGAKSISRTSAGLLVLDGGHAGG